MHLPSLFVLIVYISGYLFLLFAAICLACGLYYLVELTEEYTVLTKRIIRILILTNFTLHILLHLYERFPFLPCFIGFLSHLTYYQLLQSFPFMRLTSPSFLASIAAFVVDNVIWLRFFQSDVEVFYRYQIAPVPATAAFFMLVIWLVPSAFFCSLTVNDSVLPGANPMSTQYFAQQQQQQGRFMSEERQQQMGYQMDHGTIKSHQYQSEPAADKQHQRKNVVVVALDRAAALVKSGLTAFSSNNNRRNRSDPIFS